MNPLSPRPLFALLLVLACAAPSWAKPRADKKITADQLQGQTDPQFAKLIAATSDPQKIRALQAAQGFFNTAINDRTKVPAATQFDLKNIQSVGENVGKVLDVFIKYEKAVEEANATSQSDPNPEHVAQANQKVKTLAFAAQAQLNVLTVSLAAVPAPIHALANTVADVTASNANHFGGGPTLNAPSAEADSGLVSESKTPVVPDVELGPIAKAAAIAAQKAESIDNGRGNSNGTTPQPVPAGPTSGGTAASANGPSSGGATPYPTIGQLLGVNDPNSPSDAMADAREHYRDGDIGSGLADASRAIQLGGGAEALALRGEMQLDQKNFTAAHSDASQALQLDPSNKNAIAVYHLSETYVGAAAPKAPSFGGSAEAGAVGGSRTSAAGQVNAAQPQLSAADLRREIANALKLNDLSGALSYVNRAIAQEPNNPSLLNIRASIESRMRDYAKSEADARAGLALAPHNPALLTTQTFAQLRGKKYKDALASANELIALDPKNAYAFALRAHAEGSMGDRDAMMSDLSRAAELDPRFAKAQAQMAGEVQLPSDKDILFLFPGEEAAAAKTAAPEGGRGRSFGLLVGASALGGLLLALGLLQTVMAPLKDKLTSAFTRITRSGPAVGAREGDTAQPASVNGLVPGLIRGQYEISRQIGMGGMGLVFAGTDRSLGRPVAIKKMREELRINPAERARFVIEAKTVAALHHTNIVDIYAIAEDGDDVYLIFEFVDGKTVHDLVTQAGRLPIAETARVVRAAADALGYAHSKGVIHRDMKPSNVMIDGSGRVKVMDFGIARMAKDSMTRYSMTNTVVGTPPYMAPEQEQGHVRRESDVYALAVCAYEMLTGKLPFAGIGAGMLMNKINMSYVAPSRAIAGLPAALDEVFVKALQADPDKRYRTPKEFADALESALPAAARA